MFTTKTIRLCCILPIALVGCIAQSAEPSPSNDSAETVGEDLASASAAYFTWGMTGANKYFAKDPNGGKTMCANGTSATTCPFDRIAYPADCDQECQDGIHPNSQGYDLVWGKLESKMIKGKRQNVLTVIEGYDLAFMAAPPGLIYRILPQSSLCTTAPCPGAMTAAPVNNAGKTLRFASLDFSKAPDVNYGMRPGRAWNEVLLKWGLFASGKVVNNVFVADQVFRRWAPTLACDTYATAYGHWFTSDGFQTDFATEQQAMSYVPPFTPQDGRKWLVRDRETAASVRFTSGWNDLWAERFTIDKATCALTVVEEH